MPLSGQHPSELDLKQLLVEFINTAKQNTMAQPITNFLFMPGATAQGGIDVSLPSYNVIFVTLFNASPNTIGIYEVGQRTKDLTKVLGEVAPYGAQTIPLFNMYGSMALVWNGAGGTDYRIRYVISNFDLGVSSSYNDNVSVATTVGLKASELNIEAGTKILNVNAVGATLTASGVYLNDGVTPANKMVIDALGSAKFKLGEEIPVGTKVIGKVGVVNSDGITQINPAKEDGNLASINTATGAQADAEATSNGSVIAILKRIRTLLGGVVLAAGSAIIGKVGIDQTTPGTTNGVVLNAGANIAGKFGIDQTTPGTTNGIVVNSMIGSSAIYANTNATIGITAAVIATQACTEVTIQSDPDNSADVFVGDSLVQPIQLKPGGTITIPVTNVNLLYAKSASGTQTVNWIARN